MKKWINTKTAMKKNIQYSYPWINIPTTVEFNITATTESNSRINWGPDHDCFDALVDFFGTKEFADIALEELTINETLFISLIATTLTRWVRNNVKQFPYRKISITSLVCSIGQLSGDLLVDIECVFRI